MKLQSSLTYAVLAVAFLSLSAACGPKVAVKKGGPVDTGPGSIVAARKYLEGAGRSSRSRSFPLESPWCGEGPGHPQL
jgi:hypothetical protein